MGAKGARSARSAADAGPRLGAKEARNNGRGNGVPRDAIAATLKVLAEPHRREIVELLLDGPRSVGELMEGLRISQPRTSKHLAALRGAGLVTVRKQAQRRIYALRAEPLEELAEWLLPYRRLFEEQ